MEPGAANHRLKLSPKRPLSTRSPPEHVVVLVLQSTKDHLVVEHLQCPSAHVRALVLLHLICGVSLDGFPAAAATLENSFVLVPSCNPLLKPELGSVVQLPLLIIVQGLRRVERWVVVSVERHWAM